LEKYPFTILGITSSHSSVGSFTLVLGDDEGKRRLPIVIGPVEAQSIMLEIEGIHPHRPMTHDLMLSIGNAFHIELLEVIISEVRDAIFFAQLRFKLGETERVIDSRPSDAIALAVRFKAPLFVTEQVFKEAGIEMQESEQAEADAENKPLPSVKFDKAPEMSKSDALNLLREKMAEAIQNEDYEKAAQIRDEIQRLENS
jgi:uncharacterized protein